METLIKTFLSFYLYQLENDESLINALAQVEFHSGEANIDTEVKQTIKNYMLQNSKLNLTQYNQNIYMDIDNESYTFSRAELNQCYIKNVLLPEEFVNKDILKKGTAVYHDPDLLLEIQIAANTIYKTLEIKSTNTDKIPGSSIQQCQPDEWTIFIKHNNNNIKIITGLYANAITGRIPFPDRSPRPQVSFNELVASNNSLRKINQEEIRFIHNSQDFNQRSMILNDWRYSLAEEWVNFIKSDKMPTKWFENSLRMFALSLLEQYEKMPEEQKKALLEKNKRLQNNK